MCTFKNLHVIATGKREGKLLEIEKIIKDKSKLILFYKI